MSLIREPRKASPAGCVVMLLALLPLALSGICTWGLVVALDVPPESEIRIAPWKFGLAGALLLVLAGAMLVAGWKMAMRADMSDPWSDEKPKARF